MVIYQLEIIFIVSYLLFLMISILCDGVIIADFDHVEVSNAKRTIRPTAAISINNDSSIQLIIEQTEDNPKDLAVYLFLKIGIKYD